MQLNPSEISELIKSRIQNLDAGARMRIPRFFQFVIKYAVDRLVAGLMLLLALPFMIPAAIGILLTLGRPIFFRPIRVGRDGNTFAMLKFRTMRTAVEASVTPEAMDLPPDTAPGGVEGGDRRTPLGTFLRRTPLDVLRAEA